MRPDEFLSTQLGSIKELRTNVLIELCAFIIGKFIQTLHILG